MIILIASIPFKLEIKDTTYTARFPSYLDLYSKIESECRLRTTLYHKRNDMHFPIVDFPFICSNLPAALAYGVYFSELIRHFRACGSYHDFLDKGLTRKLLNQRFLVLKLKSSLRKCYGCPQALVTIADYLCQNDHGYVPFVVILIQSLPYSWLITGFVTRLKLLVPYMEQELPTLLEHPRFLVAFMLLDVYFSVYCFVDHCLSVWPFSFDHCIVCSLRFKADDYPVDIFLTQCQY